MVSGDVVEDGPRLFRGNLFTLDLNITRHYTKQHCKTCAAQLKPKIWLSFTMSDACATVG